jgi:hypothetical protein
MNKYLFPLLLISGSAFGFDFKGIELGKVSSYEAVSNALLIQCRDEASGNVICYGDTTIVGRPAKAYVSLNSEKIVENISVKFSPDSFENIADGFVKKYGKAKIKNSVISNAMGAQFNQVRMSWENKDAYVQIEKYADKINEGSLWMITTKKMDEVSERIEKNNSDI